MTGHNRLKTHALFQGLPSEVIDAVASCASPVRFPADMAIYQEGDDQTFFYFILTGKIALQTAAPDRLPATFLTLGPSDFAGVSWLAPPYRCRFDAIALEDTDALAIDADCLRQKCDADPALGYSLMKRFIPLLLERMRSARLQALDMYRVSP